MGITKMSKVGFKSTSYLKSDSFLVGNTAFSPTSFESIQTVTLSGSQSSIEFTSIPATYKHLQIRQISRTSRAVSITYLKMEFNGSAGSDYSYHALIGDGSTTSTDRTTNDAFVTLLRSTGTSATSGIFGAMVIDILDYANTNKYKTTRTLGGADLNGSGEIVFQSGLWRSTNAITSIKFTEATGANFVQYSSFALYGIKG
jgi:hypothetical protein